MWWLGHDQNVRLLKGEWAPLFGQDERRYMVGAVRFVKAALISSGHGWMDAEPKSICCARIAMPSMRMG